MPRISNRNQKIMEWTKGDKILNIGCSGHVVRKDSVYWLHDEIYNKFSYVVGLDISEKNIIEMRKLGYKNLYVANAETFELGEKFDTIIAGELIEHLSNPGKFLENVKRHLNPSGRLIITTPTPFALFNIIFSWTKYPNTCQNLQHTMWFCTQTLRSLFLRSGFKELHYSLIKDYELDNSSLKYKIFANIMVDFGFIFPKRLSHNCLLFVLIL